jgi:predicted nucleic acid-binding protein
MHPKPKVVLDTTALVSAFLTPEGVAAQLLNHAAADCILVLSADILAELTRKLLTKKRFAGPTATPTRTYASTWRI